jgi:hypothetical protein
LHVGTTVLKSLLLMGRILTPGLPSAILDAPKSAALLWVALLTS